MWNDASQVKSDLKKKDSSYFIFTFLAVDFFEFLYVVLLFLVDLAADQETYNKIFHNLPRRKYNPSSCIH